MAENTSFLPVYDATPEQDAEYLRRCLPLMVQNKVPANPVNYAIWYDYVAGRNIKLNDEVDILVGDHKPFDTHTSFNLYNKYICNSSIDSLEKINKGLQQLIGQTVQSVEASSAQASESSDNFQEQTTALENIENTAELKSVLSQIISETKLLAETSSVLKSRLDEANQEMEQMRNELVQVREAATTDALTGLLNRRAFDQALDVLVEDTVPENNACLVLLDLDHFKRVNDDYGHLVGDNVLRFTAAVMKKCVAEHQYAARYGGEELAIIMPETELSEASAIAEKIRGTLEKSRLKRKDNNEPIGAITLSGGIAVYKPGDTIESLISRADKALYTAKETGRNKVVDENHSQ